MGGNALEIGVNCIPAVSTIQQNICIAVVWAYNYRIAERGMIRNSNF